MAHARKAIRDDIITAVTGLTTTGSNVFQNRVYPIEQSSLPGLMVFTNEETIEASSISPPRTQIRRLTVSIEGVVRAVDNYDDTLDSICQEVEEALTADLSRNGLAKDTLITSFEAQFNGEGDQPKEVVEDGDVYRKRRNRKSGISGSGGDSQLLDR